MKRFGRGCKPRPTLKNWGVKFEAVLRFIFHPDEARNPIFSKIGFL